MAHTKEEFAGKNVLVTGGARGVGKRLALGLSRLGARLAIVGRSKAELDLASIEILQHGGSALSLYADVRDSEQVIAAFERAQIGFQGPMEMVICAAAVPGPLGPFAGTRLSAWKDTMDTNLSGVVHTCYAALPAMIKARAGKILVLACESDTSPRLNFSSYETSKAAAVRFVESLSVEVADHNIQINCLDPGPAYTNLTDEIISAEERLDPRVISQAKETRRTGGVSPDLQLEHAAFLLGPASNHISGKLIHISDDLRKLRNGALRPDSLTLRRLTK